MESTLRALAEPTYQAFSAKLVPTYAPEQILGVRVPVLRQLAKRLWREEPETVRAFLADVPHRFLEENHLHVLLIGCEPDFDKALAMTEAFLPYMDNWATTDLFSSPAFRAQPEALLAAVQRWMASSEPYTVRFGMVQLLEVYMKSHFSPEHVAWVAAVKSDAYYVEMMQAWYLSMAIVHHGAQSLWVLTEGVLSDFVHRMTIRKVRESRQASPALRERVARLRRLR